LFAVLISGEKKSAARVMHVHKEQSLLVLCTFALNYELIT